MQRAETVDFEVFRKTSTDSLPHGSEAFHGQLFPKPYPPNSATHERLRRGLTTLSEVAKDSQEYLDWVRDTVQRRGVHIKRLRTLPAQYNDEIPPMIDMCHMTAEAGEDVRIALFEPQLGRLAMLSEQRPAVRSLLHTMPRGDIWATWKPDYKILQPAEVGLMDYTDTGVLPGIQIQHPPDERILAYVAFWRATVFGSVEYSVPLDEWSQLYS